MSKNDRGSITALLGIGMRKYSHKTFKTAPRRVALLLPGGGAKSISQAGMLVAFSLLGITSDFFSVIVGSSTGSYFGTSFIFGKDAVIKLAHLLMDGARKKSYYHPLNLEYPVSTVYMEKPFKKLILSKNKQLLNKSPTAMYYAVTNTKTGKTDLLQAQKLSSSLDGMRASARVPWFDIKPVVIDGQSYLDGDICGRYHWSELKAVAMKHKITDIIILDNRKTSTHRFPLAVRVLLDIMFLSKEKLERAYKDSFHESGHTYRTMPGLPKVTVHHIRPPVTIGTLTTDEVLMRQVFLKSGAMILRMFGRKDLLLKLKSIAMEI